MNSFLNKNIIIKLLVISILAASLSFSGCGKKKDEDTTVSSTIKVGKKTDKKDEDLKEDQIERPNLREKFDDAKKQNSDTVAWIKIPSTTIDDPVVQDLQNRGKGNIDYYVHRDFKGNQVAVGRDSAIMSMKKNVTTPFKNLSNNLVISGHNVNLSDTPVGRMFEPLGNFKNLEFSKKTPYIFVTTDDKDLVYEVFASYYAEERFTYNLPKNSEKEMKDMIDEAKKRSNFIYDDVDVSEKDKVLTLYTCTYHFGSYKTLGYYRVKYVVQAKLLSDKEKLKAEANVKVNPNPKQVYYTYCAYCQKKMDLQKCSANGGVCDDCLKKQNK